MSTSSIVGIVGLVAASLIFFIALFFMFPWSLRKMVADILESAKPSAPPVQGSSEISHSPVDLEEAIYQIVRFRMVLVGSLLAFCLLLVVCSTVMLVTGEAASAEQAKKKTEKDTAALTKNQEPDRSTEHLAAKPTQPTAQPLAAGTPDSATPSKAPKNAEPANTPGQQPKP